MIRFLVLALCMVAAPASVSVAAEIETGQPAPPFDLPLVGAGGYLRSTDLFPAHEHTFLVFWESGCPHCVESLLQCQAFFEERGGEDITVVGIHTDQGSPSEVEHLIKTNGVYFQQLWDIGGETGQHYSILPAAFTLVLVSREKRVLAHRSAPQGDMSDVMREMLLNPDVKTPAYDEEHPAAAADTPPRSSESAAGFVFRGDERLRFLSIDSDGADAVGPYGEALEPGNTFLYRFDLGVSRRITRHLRVGGLLRIGNEDEHVLKAGPEYFGSPWGSAFAEVNASGVFVRLGYYEISTTSLTLARWDWDDNPRIGGNAGCGCGAAAGVLLFETLEELAPELVFEGGIAGYRPAGLETRAFYAIPRRADKTSYREAAATGADGAGYSLEVGGFETKWRRSDPRTGSSWMAGLRLVGAWEDDRSVDFVELGYRWPDPSTSSAILTADWSIPLVRFADLKGEWLVWNKAEENAEACCDTTFVSKGKGGVAGLVLEHPSRWRLRLDYIYLDSGFHSPFAALSYVPNREGARVSAEIPLPGERVLGSVFYKRLRETEAPYPGADKKQESFFGVSLDVRLPIGLGGSLGWLDAGTWRTGSVELIDDARKALVVGARYDFDKIASLQLQYQRLERTMTARGLENESSANLYSVYLSARF